MTLNELKRIAFNIATEKGWHDRDRSFEEALVLVVAELCEALEAWRDRLPAFMMIEGKPEGVVVELADAVIRLLDFAGEKEEDLDPRLVTSNLRVPPSFPDAIWLLVRHVDRCNRGNYIAQMICDIQMVAASFYPGVLLWDTVKIKMDYNRTRPKRHGGKLA